MTDTATSQPFKKQLQDAMEHEELILEQVYNCDETGLYHKMLPNNPHCQDK